MSASSTRPATAGNAARRPSMNPPSLQNTPSKSPTRSPTRMAAQSTPSSATPISRGRSVRTGTTGTPVSARAAVRKSTAASASSSATKLHDTGDKAVDEDDESRRLTLATIEDLRDQLRQADQVADEHQRQASILQARLDDAITDQGKLEQRVHEQREHVEQLEREKKDSLKSHREAESLYEAERASALKDKDEARAREEELAETVQRLKESVAQRGLRALSEDRTGKRPSLSRVSSFRSNASPVPEEGSFAPPSPLHRSDSENNSRLVLQKDRIIEGLRLELAEVQIKLVELENLGGGHVQELEKTLMETRMANARLMEDNEGFQLLLSEKTINGDFSHSSLLRVPSHDGSRPPSRDMRKQSLANELDNALDEEYDDPRMLQVEVATLKEQNKALSVYVNNILSSLLLQGGFEHILDKTPKNEKDLPPPPPPAQQTSLLQRARTAVAGKTQPRPLGQPPPKTEPVQLRRDPSPSMNEDPATAPRVPLKRSNSSRRTQPTHHRANSEWTASSGMNPPRGPSPGAGSAQLSPNLGASRPSSLFTPSGAAASTRPYLGARVPSNSTVPTLADGSSERTYRDSKISSGRNSVVSDVGETSNSASPPRSTTSSGNNERPSGAIMAGNKMRPLRLVQEAVEAEEANKKGAAAQAAQLNRASWMGWFNKPGTRSMSGEMVPRVDGY